jgi:hypothetical protein
MNTLDELEAIRARHEEDGPSFRTGMTPDQRQKYTDRATLLRLLDAAREELREVREAAGPFLRDRAEIADGIPDDTSFSMVEFRDLGVAEFTVGDLRRLAAALKAPHKGTPMLIDGDERTTVRIFTPYAKDATT